MFIHPMRNPEMNNSNTRPALLFVWFDITRVWFGLIECISSRFATRTARTQGIGWRGKKRAYLAQPKADWGQTWPSLALTWAEQERTWAQLGRNLRRTRATWLQLGPGFNMAQLGHVSTQAGLSMRNGGIWRRSWAQDKPNVGNMTSHKPGNSSENASFQRGALSGQNWLGLGPTWPQATPKDPNLAQLGPKLRKVGKNWPCWAEVGPEATQMDSKLKPCDAHGNPSQF